MPDSKNLHTVFEMGEARGNRSILAKGSARTPNILGGERGREVEVERRRHRRVETPGAARMWFARVPPATISSPSAPTDKKPETCLSGWSRCLVGLHGGRSAICNGHRSLQTMFSNCTFRREGGVFVCRSPQKPCSVCWKCWKPWLSPEPGPGATSSSFSGAGHASRERESPLKGCHRQNAISRLPLSFSSPLLPLLFHSRYRIYRLTSRFPGMSTLFCKVDESLFRILTIR